jgi:hypothetical protein
MRRTKTERKKLLLNGVITAALLSRRDKFLSPRLPAHLLMQSRAAAHRRVRIKERVHSSVGTPSHIYTSET